MEKFTKFSGQTAHMPLNDIDTDRIIPKQYLKTIKRVGLGKFLFAEMRFDNEGVPIKDFVLNQKLTAKILLTGENFGCGSSREHAPWSILDFGIKVIIAPSFADIFYNNCFKNGLLPIILSEKIIEELSKNEILEVDLINQKINSDIKVWSFEIEEHNKKTLLEGLDEVQQLLLFKNDILKFEDEYYKKFTWLEY